MQGRLATVVSSIRISAGAKQSRHKRLVSVSHRRVQWLIAKVVPRCGIGAGIQQRGDHAGLATPAGCLMQRRHSVLVARLKVCARIQKLGKHVGVEAVLLCPMHDVRYVIVDRSVVPVTISSGARSHDVDIASRAGRGAVQWGGPIRISHCGIGPGIQERGNYAWIAVVCRYLMQRCSASQVPRIRIRTGIQ